MISDLPFWINGLFILCLLWCLLFFYLETQSFFWTTFWILWSFVHSVLSFNGFHTNTEAFPPRFLLILIPSIILVLFLFYALKKPNNRKKTYFFSSVLHLLRLPIEIVLWQLYLLEWIPQLMTFEGRNFDIIAGCTAPIIAFYSLSQNPSKYLLISWNILSLFLILFILVNALLSAELPIQQFAFDQPNRAVLYFPFTLLPATIVPIVILMHLRDLKSLLLRETSA